MGLIADLDAASTESNRGRHCGFAKWLETLSEDERQAVRNKIGRIPDLALATIITENGYRVSSSTIAGHRRNECMTCRS